MSLHALVEKWRRKEVENGEAGDEWEAAIYRECADELAAALAGGGEAVATVAYTEYVASRGEWRATVWTPIEIPARTPLFTHPAGAVQVDEAMVERACDAFTSHDAGDWLRNAMRVALFAALNPGGSRE